MLKLTRNGETWQVVRDGETVYEGTMAEARAEFARLMKAQLAAKQLRLPKKIFR